MTPALCVHTVPAFGCDACITKEREGTLAEAAKTTAPQACPDCGDPMVLYDKNAATMTLLFVCSDPGWDGSSRPACEGTVEVKVR